LTDWIPTAIAVIYVGGGLFIAVGFGLVAGKWAKNEKRGKNR